MTGFRFDLDQRRSAIHRHHQSKGMGRINSQRFATVHPVHPFSGPMIRFSGMVTVYSIRG
jgi:hypothetical protein